MLSFFFSLCFLDSPFLALALALFSSHFCLQDIQWQEKESTSGNTQKKANLKGSAEGFQQYRPTCDQVINSVA
ncbi:hypothetical protein BD560DRAFT_386011 [Blakeslea trispora]|nr:hypothetical protein BD560DRAFT_386011 [Blakeslea trispora]